MQTLFKITLSVLVILAATAVARRWPSTAGLIGVMPLAGALVLVWVYQESKGDRQTMLGFTNGALWGILPSVLFYIVALIGFRQQFSLPAVLAMSFGAWLGAAFLHQWLLK